MHPHQHQHHTRYAMSVPVPVYLYRVCVCVGSCVMRIYALELNSKFKAVLYFKTQVTSCHKSQVTRHRNSASTQTPLRAAVAELLLATDRSAQAPALQSPGSAACFLASSELLGDFSQLPQADASCSYCRQLTHQQHRGHLPSSARLRYSIH
jgi:hypothetical protein